MSAVGGLREGFPPGTFVVPDQFIDHTHGRSETYYKGSPTDEAPDAGVQHLPAAEPFCPRLRILLREALSSRGQPYSPIGTVVVINGPRFSTKAESAWYVAAGADIISMTQYAEPVLAAELNMGFANLAYITDSDTGHDGTGASCPPQATSRSSCFGACCRGSSPWSSSSATDPRHSPAPVPVWPPKSPRLASEGQLAHRCLVIDVINATTDLTS
jgi:hypothetical protein